MIKEDSLVRKRLIDEFYNTEFVKEDERLARAKQLELLVETYSFWRIRRPNTIPSNLTRPIITKLEKEGVRVTSSSEGFSKYEKLDGELPYIKYRSRSETMMRSIKKTLRREGISFTSESNRRTGNSKIVFEVDTDWEWSYRGGKKRFWNLLNKTIK